MGYSIRWFPPSWLQIKSNNKKVIYIDPAWIQKNFDTHPTKIIFNHYPDPIDGLPEENMEKADIILIIHHHQDHIKKVTLNRLATSNTVIIAPEKCRILIERNFEVIKPGDKKTVNEISIQAVSAYNTPEGDSTRKQHHKGECVGYKVTIDKKTIYHAGDTDLIPEMKHLGDIEVAFLPIGGTFTMNIKEAVEALNAIKPKIAIPMHFLKANPSIFKNLVERKTKSEVRLLGIGETIIL